MCAVIGAFIQNPSAKDFSLIKKVFLESKIRGMHATGISYLKSDKIITVKDVVSADKFSFDFESYLNEDGNLYLIGHCRYSTSDLEYNQPLDTNEKSIVHNGVITQELPEKWKELYGYDCITKNDSELVLYSEDPLREFPHMSMGVCELYADKKLRFYRNGKRPIYYTLINNGCIVTSTKDIAHRSGLDSPSEVLMNTYVTVDSQLSTKIESVNIDNVDLQKVKYEKV